MATKRQNAEVAPSRAESGGFRGFGVQALPFLQAIRENNDREWFALNKATYLEECDAPLRELVRAIGDGLEARGIPLAPPARSPVFRIYRDVRFARDKRPYKTNVGAALYPGGDKARPGLFYIHVEPGRSFLAAGFHQPEAPVLKAFRAAIAADPAGVERLIATLKDRGVELGDGDPLTRLPKGFEDQADSPVAAILRKRSLIASRPLADDDLERRDLPEVAIAFAVAAYPLLAFFAGRVAEVGRVDRSGQGRSG